MRPSSAWWETIDDVEAPSRRRRRASSPASVAGASTPIVYTAHSLDRAEAESGEWISHGPIQDEAIAGADLVVALSRSESRRIARFYPED